MDTWTTNALLLSISSNNFVLISMRYLLGVSSGGSGGGGLVCGSAGDWGVTVSGRQWRSPGPPLGATGLCRPDILIMTCGNPEGDRALDFAPQIMLTTRRSKKRTTFFGGFKWVKTSEIVLFYRLCLYSLFFTFQSNWNPGLFLNCGKFFSWFLRLFLCLSFLS